MTDVERSIIRRQIQTADFGFYTDDEVRSRSILEITNPLTYDSLNTPLPGGLYSPQLGPIDSRQNAGVGCITCGNTAENCPGHSGHIELCVPLYHPLTFKHLLQFLKAKCFNCHDLRLSDVKKKIYELKFRAIVLGRVNDALSMDDEYLCETNAGISLDNFFNQKKQHFANLEKQLRRRNGGSPPMLTAHERAVQKETIKSFISDAMAAKQCASCMAWSPKIRHDSSNKIFQQMLSDRHKMANMAARVKLRSALSVKEEDVDKRVGGEGGGGGWMSDDSDGEGDTNRQGGGWHDHLDHATTSSRPPRPTPDSDSEEDDDILGNTTPTVKKNDGIPTDKFMQALEVEAQVRLTWRRHPYLCRAGWGDAHYNPKDEMSGWSLFFMRVVAVIPSRFRPPMMLGDMTVEHGQNGYLVEVLKTNMLLVENFGVIKKLGDDLSQEGLKEEERVALRDERDRHQAYAISAWIKLQTQLNCYMDSSKDTGYGDVPNGIRQLLEKKEGLFRKFMMGKRVDYACRSVISPDPYIGTNEIGLPLYFAKTLTYPTPVTALNVENMRKLVKNGTQVYPGANWVEEVSTGFRYDLSKMIDVKREALAARLLSSGGLMRVGRQLMNGDCVLMNRQPTLHKPGIMSHYVRVLHSPTQKTIRMHYANCNTYNADYDGDEMNCHFPQNDLARAEAMTIMSTDNNYIVPTDGSPLRGLIQDHVDGGVLLTQLDSFIEREMYQQLLMATLASLPGLEVVKGDADIMMMPPAIRKPRELWTGKQVISTLLMHLKGKMPGISVERKTKTPPVAFGEHLNEHKVIIRDGELLRGVLDKAAFGATDFGLVHAVYEAYGGEKAGLLLNALGRLFTSYIQSYAGHSCRMEDLILTPEANVARRGLVEAAYAKGSRAAKAWVDSEGGKAGLNKVTLENVALSPAERAATSEKLKILLSGEEGATNAKNYDAYMQSQLNPLSSEIIKGCLPHGLAVLFPKNTFSLMVNTGAKGSTVNQSQVSCGLGQQALEGQRVPRMSSGKTLPSFGPYDPHPRADGFITDRFLTGIRPQEYYFHCMAGREGLVDTAVKTSRSGYLQRCLVKHLEELKVCYDYTVRDGEGGVVQFLYGEDGIDPTKAAHLDCSKATLEYMARNQKALSQRYPPLPHASIEASAKRAIQHEKIQSASNDLSDMKSLLTVGCPIRARKRRNNDDDWRRGNLRHGWFPATIKKIHKHHRNQEPTYDITYTDDNVTIKRIPLSITYTSPHTSQTLTNTLLYPHAPDPLTHSSTLPHILGQSGSCVSERVARATHETVTSQSTNASNPPHLFSHLSPLIASKYSSSLAAPGEAVGCIAAQSIGEPSTQMTLNTFHLAGSGANVTLGIPRLREIIMTASKTPKTPTMSIPVRDDISDEKATQLSRRFVKLTLKELLASRRGVTVRETLQRGASGSWERAYYVTLKLQKAERIKTAFGLRLEDVAKVVTSAFIPRLSYLMKLESRRASQDGQSIVVEGGAKSTFVEEGESQGRGGGGGNDFDDDDGDDDEDNDFGDEDGVNALRSNMKEMVSYGDMDDDDIQISKSQPNDDIDVDSDDNSSTSSSDKPTTKPTTPDATIVTDDEDDHDNKQTQLKEQRDLEQFFKSSMNAVKIDHAKDTLFLQPLRVDPSARPLLMINIVESAASSTVVRSRPGISEAYINEEKENNRGRCLQTLGSNITEMWKLESNLVRHDGLLSNDIWAMRNAYGVEAAGKTIQEQIKAVFAVYGIEVDPRHLSLIADYMTYDGGYKAMNRLGMGAGSSAFLKMSFETTAVFMTDSAMRREREMLMSPSANIVVGRPVRMGTGAFECIVKG